MERMRGRSEWAFGEALGAMYVKKHFPQSSKDEVRAHIHNQ